MYTSKCLNLSLVLFLQTYISSYQPASCFGYHTCTSNTAGLKSSSSCPSVSLWVFHILTCPSIYPLAQTGNLCVYPNSLLSLSLHPVNNNHIHILSIPSFSPQIIKSLKISCLLLTSFQNINCEKRSFCNMQISQSHAANQNTSVVPITYKINFPVASSIIIF